MFPVKEFEKRFREILTMLDGIAEEVQSEDLDEMNAAFEDALFVIESIGAEDEDWREAFEDALDEFDDLHAEYEGLTDELPSLAEPTERLMMLIGMVRNNLE